MDLKFIVKSLCFIYSDAYGKHLISFGSLINTLKNVFKKISIACVPDTSMTLKRGGTLSVHFRAGSQQPMALLRNPDRPEQD